MDGPAVYPDSRANGPSGLAGGCSAPFVRLWSARLIRGAAPPGAQAKAVCSETQYRSMDQGKSGLTKDFFVKSVAQKLTGNSENVFPRYWLAHGQ